MTHTWFAMEAKSCDFLTAWAEDQAFYDWLCGKGGGDDETMSPPKKDGFPPSAEGMLQRPMQWCCLRRQFDNYAENSLNLSVYLQRVSCQSILHTSPFVVGYSKKSKVLSISCSMTSRSGCPRLAEGREEMRPGTMSRAWQSRLTKLWSRQK